MDTDKSTNGSSIIFSNLCAILHTHLLTFFLSYQDTYHGTFSCPIFMAFEYAYRHPVICTNFPTNFETITATNISSVHETVVSTNNGTDRTTFFIAFISTVNSTNISPINAAFISAINGTDSSAIFTTFFSTFNSAIVITDIST
jgi:hypothetical protein